MKKELKKYFLTSYHGTRETIVQTKMEYEELLKKVDKYNKNNKSKYLFGNITCVNEQDGLHVTAHIYDKLTGRDTISNLLDIVGSNDYKSLMLKYKNKIGNNDGYLPDINIAYLESKDTRGKRKYKKDETYYERGIKYLPMFYSSDRKYFSIEYLKRCMRFHAENYDYNFFKALAYKFSINHGVSSYCDDLWQEVDKVEHQGYEYGRMLELGKKLLDAYILERDSKKAPIRNENGAYEYSKKRILDAATFVRFYGNENRKVNSPLCYNAGLTDEKRKELEYKMEDEQQLELIKYGKAHYEQLKIF